MQYTLLLDPSCYHSFACYLASAQFNFPAKIEIAADVNIENRLVSEEYNLSKFKDKKLQIATLDTKPVLIVNIGNDLIKIKGIRAILLYIYRYTIKDIDNFYNIYHYFDLLERLEALLTGVNKLHIDNILQKLDDHLSTSDYLLDKITPVDIYLYSMLSAMHNFHWKNLSKFHSNLHMFANHLSKFKLTQQFYDYSTQPYDNLSVDIKKCKNYYIATAIAYTNGLPHLGHVYEMIISDVIARYHSIIGKNVLLGVGSDEHGQKIANTASKHGKLPIEICNEYQSKFVECYKSMNVDYSIFTRTTSDKHKKLCRFMWEKIKNKGDIYLNRYRGWYNEREETFIAPNEAKLNDYKDPQNGMPYQIMEEESYFFRMSKYQHKLIEYIDSNPHFIQPEIRRNDIIARLSVPLEDLSISRTSFSWGIKVPDSDNHIMYVWFDALLNYITAVSDNDCNVSDYWPPEMIIIGKDISWFHSVILSTILMAADLPLPKSIICHGFIHASDGRKMSKSFQNVIDPMELLMAFPCDTIRYYLIKSCILGQDIKFGTDFLTDAHNNELSDCIGNLVHRVTGLCAKFCDSKVPEINTSVTLQKPFQVMKVLNKIQDFYAKNDLYNATNFAVDAWRETNKYLTNISPWSISDKCIQNEAIRVLLNSIYILAHLIYPVIPESSNEIFARLHTPKRMLSKLSPWFDNLASGTKIEVRDVLFTKIT
ncbi:methionyl-tRNA synthetase [Babesia microti strain RI]|uniref:methionine--tRNA ligase n=1 Tax=Babesia microti (strain RI) TaxID=1133968 RepID=I7I8R7_BABMR|nr:methionyl-tRNA synthetase [Babesia microti strain RI]CCF73558.1 methionyl-tRNA synthetase [Babesia microti strain RI]|eukprot:XP_012648167.1 methionyl-tRNA synthetase [Babesia microti strain RI]